MSATIERPKSAIQMHAELSEQVYAAETEIWQLTKTTIPALHRRGIAGDVEAKDEIAVHRARIRDLEGDVELGRQGIAELEDLVAQEHAAARARERRAAFTTVAKMSAQRQAIADEMSEVFERLPVLARKYDAAVQAEKQVAFPHLSIDAALNHEQRTAADLLAARVGHTHLLGTHASPTHMGDPRTISELAAAHIATFLGRLT